MDELVQWLGEQLSEDEAAIEAPESWTEFDEMHGTRSVRVDHSIEHVVACTRSWRGVHIASHDPAQVLREIDAKRKLLDDYVLTARIRDEAAVRIKAAGDCPNPKDLEEWDRAQREAAILEGPVKLAASPLSHRPGYRDEWRP